MTRVHSVQVGRVAPLGPQGVPSAFVKHTAEDRTAVFELGLDGDEQADLRVHGGREKAVYAYPLDHYHSWKAGFPEHAEMLVPGAFGENLTIDGLIEADICVGDVHRIGTAVLQVCQPRQPCFKLTLHFNDNRLAAAMVKSGRSGWYYRVLSEGKLGAGDEVELIDRPQPNFSFTRLVEFVNFGRGTSAELLALSRMKEAPSKLQQKAAEKLADRSERLGPS